MPLAGGTFSGDVTFDGATAGYDIVWDKSDNALEWADNAKAKFGTGGDLEIFHNASNSVINDAGTGDLLLQVGGTTQATISSTGVVIANNLTVSGTTTTINTQTLDVEDKNVVIGKVSSPSDTTADGGGWTLKGATDKTFNWVNATDAWTSSEHIHLIDNKKLLVGGASGTVDGLEIVHNGSNSILNDTGTGTLQLQLGGSTKLEVTSGGINVTGAITVDGSALASGNTFTAVANGAIANNKAVKIDTDGKVSQIAETSTAMTNPSITPGLSTNGSYASGTSEDGYAVKCVDVGNDRILVAWTKDNWPSSGKVGGKAVIGARNSSNQYSAFGAEFQWATNTGFDKWDVAYDSTNSTIIFSYTDDENSGKGYSRFCKYNTSTKVISDITSGNTTVQWRNASDTRSIVTHWDNSIQRLILAYQAGNGQGGHSVVLAKNSGNDSYSSTYAGDMCGSTNAGVIQSQEVCITGLTSGKVVSFWNGEDGNFHYAIGVVNTSNNTIAWGTRVQAKSDEQMYPMCAYNSDKNVIAFAGRHTGGSNYPYAHFAVFNNSNNTIGGWAGVAMKSISSEGVAIAYDPDSVRFIVSYMIGSGPNHWEAKAYVHGTVDNASSYTTTNDFNFVGTNMGNNFNNLGNFTAFPGKGLVIGGFNAVSISGRVIINQVTTTEDQSNMTDGQQYMGYADQAYTNGQTATIKTVGNVAETLSGLTAGTKYYVQADGTVATTADGTLWSSPANTPVAGTALNYTTLLIKDPRISPNSY